MDNIINAETPATGKPMSNNEARLLFYLEEEVNVGALSEYEMDLLPIAMTELIASEKFAGMNGECRRSLFDQYRTLLVTIDVINNFLSKS